MKDPAALVAGAVVTFICLRSLGIDPVHLLTTMGG